MRVSGDHHSADVTRYERHELCKEIVTYASENAGIVWRTNTYEYVNVNDGVDDRTGKRSTTKCVRLWSYIFLTPKGIGKVYRVGLFRRTIFTVGHDVLMTRITLEQLLDIKRKLEDKVAEVNASYGTARTSIT